MSGGVDEYDHIDDLNKSMDLAYKTIRERMAAGGPGWEEKKMASEKKRTGSFPFFNLARDHGVPYETVLKIAECFDEIYRENGTLRSCRSTGFAWSVYRVWKAEKIRRLGIG